MVTIQAHRNAIGHTMMKPVCYLRIDMEIVIHYRVVQTAKI